GFFFVVESEGRQHGPEGLFSCQSHAGPYSAEDRRPHEVAPVEAVRSTTTCNQASALRLSTRNMAHDARQLGFRYQWGDIRIIGTRSDGLGLEDRSQPVEEVALHRPLDNEA